MDDFWGQLILSEQKKAYFKQLLQKIKRSEQRGASVFPPRKRRLLALEACPWSNTKVVILGQDPYPGKHQAHGLAFSVTAATPPPPSLKNIFKAINHDFNTDHDFSHGCLDSWTKQGVLLLNTILSVEHGQALSHANWGWETFTDRILEALNHHPQSLVFMLWGKPAQKKIACIDEKKHLVLCAPHPSPLSAYRGFLNCQHFSRANAHLSAQGRAPIEWFF